MTDFEGVDVPKGTCIIEGCEKTAQARGWCPAHYARWRQNGDPGPAEVKPYRNPNMGGRCSIDGCGRNVRRGDLCKTHYERSRVTGVLGGDVVPVGESRLGECLVEGCGRAISARGMCQTHRKRAKAGLPMGEIRVFQSRPPECTVDGCRGPVVARGWCSQHYHELHTLPAVAGREACAFPGCDRPQRYPKIKLCAGHYAQQLRSTTSQPLRQMSDPRARDDQGRKQCRGCWTWLEEGFYAVNNFRPDKLNAYCRKCDQDTSLGQNWGMTRSEYEEMIERQGGGCAICGHPGSEKNRLAIDHDHACCPGKKGRKTCGKCIRAILCTRCNAGLGQFFDDPEILEAAAAYVRSHSAVAAV